MQVLVTGGAGYLGSLTARNLLARGHRVRVLDSLLHGGDALLSLYPLEGFELVRGDVRDDDAVGRALEGVDAVVHLAAIVGDPACKRDPSLSRDVNERASLRLYERAGQAGAKRFVFASTCSNYGRMADPESYVDERSELAPLSVYAETKVAVELALLDGERPPGPTPTVLRFATLHGLSPRPRLDLTVNQFAAELEVDRRLEVFGERFWRPYVHVADAAEAIAEVLEADEATVGGEVFNVGSTAENYTKQMIVEEVTRQLDEPPDISYVEVADDPRDYRVSFAKIEGAMGFRPGRTVPRGIAEVLDAVRNGVLADIADPRYRN